MLIKKLTIVLLTLICLLPAYSWTGPGGGDVNIYRVEVGNREDASYLTGLGVNAFMRVRGGYLIQAPSAVEKDLHSGGIIYELVARNLVRGNLVLDTRRDKGNAEKYPAVYEDGDLRLFHIGPEKEDLSEEWRGLTPVLTDNLKITYNDPPRLDFSRSPDMLDLDSLASSILEDSCQSYIERLEAFQTRWSGTDSNLASRDWLIDKFDDFGYDSVYTDTFMSNHTYGGWDLVQAHNVIAVKVGSTYPDHHIVFGAHRDTYPVESPGADDDGSGCGAVLEIARVLKDVETKMTFIFVLFDTEETGLFGSWNYSNRAAMNGDSIVVMVNLDVIGYNPGGDRIVDVSNTPGSPFGQIFQDLADSLPSIDLDAPLSEWAYADGLSFEMNGFRVIEAFEHLLNPFMHSAYDSTVHLDFDYITRITRASLATAYVIDHSYIPDPMLKFSFPDGIPELLYPNQPTAFNVAISTYADGLMVPGSGLLHYSLNGAAYATLPLNDLGGGLFEAVIPSFSCDSRVDFYISAQENSGETFTSTNIENPHLASTGIEHTVIAEYDFEEYDGWQAYGDAVQGPWSRYYPHGYGHNAEVAIDFDGSGMCYLTGPEPLPWNYRYTDVDGGTTRLRSPTLDMSGGQILIEYARWYSNHYGASPYNDVFEVYISNDDGQTWTLVESVGPVYQASGGWFTHRFWVNDIVEPTTQMRLRFDASDLGNDSNIEAAVDAVRISRYSCGPAVEIITESIPDWTEGVPFNENIAVSGGYGTISWIDRDDNLAGTGLALSSDGILSGTPSAPGPTVFTARAVDELLQDDEAEYTFTINEALSVITESIDDGIIGVPYSFQLMCDGGTGDKSWLEIGEGLAGSGISLLAEGILSGTPTDTGLMAFTAHVSDQAGAEADRAFEFYVSLLYQCGDANGDKEINVGDAVFMINYVFKSGPAPDPLEAGDANCDGEANVGDAVYLIGYVFKEGAEPCCP